MASTPSPIRLFLLFLLTISLSTSSHARPCKSLFVSFSLLRHRTLDSRNPFSDMAVIVDITEFKSFAADDETQFPSPLDLPRQDYVASHQQHPDLGFSYDFSSLRDRTMDILSVVVALLFGVGCGALTAATMYLAFSLCSARFGHRSSVYDDFSDEEDDNKENIDNMGYVKIPDGAAPAKSVNSCFWSKKRPTSLSNRSYNYVV